MDITEEMKVRADEAQKREPYLDRETAEMVARREIAERLEEEGGKSLN